MSKSWILLLLMLACRVAAAQGILTGKVIDAVSRQPLEAASVEDAARPNTKVVTDQYGNFSIPARSDRLSLVVSFVGYKSVSVKVTAAGSTTVELQPDVANLKDVIVLHSASTTRFASLSRIDLDLHPVRNTQELMRLVPGLFIAQHAGGGKAEQIFLRGFDCDHGTDVAVSVDGIPVNMVSHAHGQGYADAHFIIPETINSIDYGAGPYYTNLGNLNTAGYVAFSTYDNISQSRVQVEAGRFNTLRTLAMVDLLTKNKDRQSAYVTGDFYYSDGPTKSKQAFNRFNVFAKYRLLMNDRTQLSATVSAFKSKWDASGQVPSRAVDAGIIDRFGSIDPTEGGNTERYNVNLRIAHRLQHGGMFENQAYFTRYLFNLYSDFTFYRDDPVHGDEINQAERRNLFGYLSSFRQRYIFPNWSLQSFYGAGLRYDATDDSRLAHVAKRQFLNNIQLGDIHEYNLYAYAQQQVNAGKWLFDLGARIDYLHFSYLDQLASQQLPSNGKAIASPKFNVQYTINRRVQLFVKTGKGFHSNDTRVVVANGGREILPAAFGADAGIILKPSDRLLLHVAAWYLYLQQEFVYVGDEGNIEPSGKTRREGIDLIARYQFTSHLFGSANVNLTRPRAIGEPKGENYIPLAPTATSTGGLFYRRGEGFNGSISYRYIRRRPANEDYSVVAKGYFLLDASINYTHRKYEVGLSLENIFNVKWNEAQFATESRLQNEPMPVTELNYTPGAPFFIKLKTAIFF